MTGSSTFINSTSLGNVDDDTRLLIRRHVMRGKNRRKHVAKLRAGSWMNRESTHGEINGSREARLPSLALAKPACLFSDSSTLQSVQPLPPYMLRLILNYFRVLIKSFYPIEVCLAFDSRNSFWFEYISIDAAYLHSLLWAAQTYFGALQGHPEARAAAFHEQQTLALLQRRLDDMYLATSDSTIAVVAILVMLCVVSGNDTAATKHMEGLHQIVMLRGGLRELKSNTQLQIKVCRADLSNALTCGCRPFFFSKGISWEPYLARQADFEDASNTSLFNFDVDTRLLSIFVDLRKFSVSANLASQTRDKIHPELFQETLISIHYRLILLDLKDRWSLNEAVRLGLLAFSATVFLQIQSVKVRFTHLSKQLNDVLPTLCDPRADSSATKIWYPFIAAVVAVATGTGNPALALLTKTLESAGLDSWTEVRAVLKEFLWIDAIHDVHGKRIYKQAVEEEHA